MFWPVTIELLVESRKVGTIAHLNQLIYFSDMLTVNWAAFRSPREPSEIL